MSVKNHLEDFCIDLLCFCLLVSKLIRQELFSDSNEESPYNKTNLTGIYTNAIAAAGTELSVLPDVSATGTITKIRRWMACMSSGRRVKKKLNEESNYNSFFRESDPDRAYRKWRISATLYRIGRKPAYSW